MSPRVSVIIPTYRHRELILGTLATVLAQTCRDFEVIVVDDGSSDGTEELLRSLADRGEIRYHRQANGGPAAARNMGLSLARGDYVAFLDDDDLWPADKLAWQVACLDSSKDVAVGGTMRPLAAGDEADVPAVTTGSHSQEVGLADLFRDGNVFQSPGQALIRREALLRVGGFDDQLWGTDDYDLWMRLVRLGVVRRSDRLSLVYRVHSGNASADLVRMTENIEAVLRKNAPTEKADDRRLRRAGYRHLFRWQGKRLIWEGARLWWQGRKDEGARLFRHGLRCGLAGAPRDPVLLALLLLALLKVPYKACRRP